MRRRVFSSPSRNPFISLAVLLTQTKMVRSHFRSFKHLKDFYANPMHFIKLHFNFSIKTETAA